MTTPDESARRAQQPRRALGNFEGLAQVFHNDLAHAIASFRSRVVISQSRRSDADIAATLNARSRINNIGSLVSGYVVKGRSPTAGPG